MHRKNWAVFFLTLFLLLPFSLSENAFKYANLLEINPPIIQFNSENSCSASCSYGFRKVNSLELTNLENYSSVIFYRNCNQTYLCVKKKEVDKKELSSSITNTTSSNSNLTEELSFIKGELEALKFELNKTRTELNQLILQRENVSANMGLNNKTIDNSSIKKGENKSFFNILRGLFKKGISKF